ncbi:MAG: hypothetical protein B6I20_02545 [Bacteroidetes bacterium 4572_117]|nr:MAG: hypothetical protein B6I20_02545 [Bacteroidetes bacterium 4572_117]
MTNKNYSIITETPGQKADSEQLERTLQRYKFAKEFTTGKNVLEVACGSGIGLSYLAENAKSVIGIDIDDNNLKVAKNNVKKTKYADQISIKKMDAQELKFKNNQFDIVLLFEAIYYLKTPEKFITEAHRILKKGGTLIISSVNKNWESFHPSPLTYNYFSIPEYQILIKDKFKPLNYYGGFYTNKDSRLFSLIKKNATKFNLIPGSLKTRALLKRVFMGKLNKLPLSINNDMAKYYKPELISEIIENKDYKIIYIVAKK